MKLQHITLHHFTLVLCQVILHHHCSTYIPQFLYQMSIFIKFNVTVVVLLGFRFILLSDWSSDIGSLNTAQWISGWLCLDPKRIKLIWSEICFVLFSLIQLLKEKESNIKITANTNNQITSFQDLVVDFLHIFKSKKKFCLGLPSWLNGNNNKMWHHLHFNWLKNLNKNIGPM